MDLVSISSLSGTIFKLITEITEFIIFIKKSNFFKISFLKLTIHTSLPIISF